MRALRPHFTQLFAAPGVKNAMPTTTLRRLGALPLALLLILAGCSSDSSPGERREGFAGGHSKPPTPMAGQESFFDQQILAEITVGAEALPPGGPDQGGGDQGNNGSGGGRRHGGGGMNVRGGTGGGVGGNLSGNIPFGGGGGSGDRPARSSDDDVGSYHGSHAVMGGRPVEIHLRFTNKGTAPVTLVIDDFTSPLGNFAVRPESLTIDAGQSAETEPMSSQLAGLYSEADATLVLRVGGKTEKKTFTLHAVVPPPAPAADPAKTDATAPAK
jgi:hypothetical protein